MINDCAFLAYFITDVTQELFDLAVQHQVRQNHCAEIRTPRCYEYQARYAWRGLYCPIGVVMTPKGLAFIEKEGEEEACFSLTSLGKKIAKEYPEQYSLLCALQLAYSNPDRGSVARYLVGICKKHGLSDEELIREMTPEWVKQPAPWIVRYEDST